MVSIMVLMGIVVVAKAPESVGWHHFARKKRRCATGSSKGNSRSGSDDGSIYSRGRLHQGRSDLRNSGSLCWCWRGEDHASGQCDSGMSNGSSESAGSDNDSSGGRRIMLRQSRQGGLCRRRGNICSGSNSDSRDGSDDMCYAGRERARLTGCGGCRCGHRSSCGSS